MEIQAIVHDARVQASSDEPLKTCQSLGMIGERPHPCSYQGLRSFILYHFLPYDKSMFGTLEDPVYIFFFILSMMPDIRVIFYLVVLFLFVVPGPPDEFQLVQFIMMFKGTQFISGGVAMMACGGTQYFWCITDVSIKDTGGKEYHGHTCDTDGPGSSQPVLVGVLDIIGSCVLVWTAFRLLDISVNGAGDRQSDPYLGHESGMLPTDEEVSAASVDEREDMSEKFLWRCCFRGRKAKGRGGRLRGFLKYDLICVSMCLGLLLLMELHWSHTEDRDPGEAS